MHTQQYAAKVQARINSKLIDATSNMSTFDIMTLRDLAMKNVEIAQADVARYNAIIEARETIRRAAESDEACTCTPLDGGLGAKPCPACRATAKNNPVEF